MLLNQSDSTLMSMLSVPSTSEFYVQEAGFGADPSTSPFRATLVIRVSKRHADALSSRPDIVARHTECVSVTLGRNIVDEDNGTRTFERNTSSSSGLAFENIVLQGTLDGIKSLLSQLVKEVWLPRRLSRTIQIQIPLNGVNSTLARYTSRGDFSRAAELSESIISLDQDLSGASFSQATIEGDRESLSKALDCIVDLLRPPDSVQVFDRSCLSNQFLPSIKRARIASARHDVRPLPRRATALIQGPF